MRVKTLEIRWHDSKPINSCDFQPVPFKKARPAHERDFVSQSYKLATGGEDNNVRIWMVHPNIMPPSVAAGAGAGASSSSNSTSAAPHPPRVEYLATLSKHQAPVNVVRFSPNGELLASAGDDGMIIIWAPSSTPPTSNFGQEPDELQYDKEYWKPRTPFRCTTMQVYDLAWSPTGDFVIAGSTDNTARIFSAHDGKCVREIAEHSHFVQGVAWDPLNEYIATQSSDRAVHVYSVSARPSAPVEVHAVGKNTKVSVRHSRTPSVGSRRPRMRRAESAASDAESAITSASEQVGMREKREREEEAMGSSAAPISAVPLTPAPSIASTPSHSVFLPPPSERPISRRSSFSSNAPGSPSQFSTHLGRSPSPMPPLPAIRAPPSPQLFAQTRLYGDESFTNFFRRLTFSPDGGLLLTPSGHFEDITEIPWSNNNNNSELQRGRRGNPADLHRSDPSSASSVYIYSRANFARPPIAQLPGHKKASVAVKFSPVLYQLRPNVVGAAGPKETRSVAIAVERGGDKQVDLDVVGPVAVPETPIELDPSSSNATSPKKPSSDMLPSPSPIASHPAQTLPSPALTAVDGQPQTPVHVRRVPTPSTNMAGSSTSSSAPQTGSIFALPYRMLFAVATMDTITIHDTQQAGPICLLTKLHYDEFTDMAWSPDGQCLVLTSRDGYCTIVIFDQILPAYHTQQQALQLQSIAYSHSHSHAHAHSHSVSHHHHHSSTHSVRAPTPSTSSVYPSASPAVTPSPTPAKRSAPLPSIPLASEAGESRSTSTSTGNLASASEDAQPQGEQLAEPPKKKRRVALTRVGDLGSS